MAKVTPIVSHEQHTGFVLSEDAVQRMTRSMDALNSVVNMLHGNVGRHETVIAEDLGTLLMVLHEYANWQGESHPYGVWKGTLTEIRE